MNLSNVKSIVIPEGTVKKITDGDGNVLWKKPPEWHTLWSGSRQIKSTGNYSNSGTITGNNITLVNAQSIDTEESSIKLRITFTNYSASGSAYQSVTAYTPSTKQSSPYTVTKGTASSLTDLLGVSRNGWSSAARTYWVRALAMLQYSFNSNHQLTIKTKATVSKYDDPGSGSATAQITITKVEAYY